MKVKELVGSGERIGLLALPFIVVGVTANVLWPSVFSVGGPGPVLQGVASAVLAVGVASWLWSVVLILTRVPKHLLITTGPYALVKHPLYTAVGLLVIPSVGILLDTWLGIVIGLVVYAGSRLFAPDEEHALAEAFGGTWDEYAAHVLIPWL